MMCETYSEILRARGYRMTPQRLAILRILIESGCHLSPLEICHQAQQAMPGMTEATVYRTLAFLHEQGLVMAAHVGSGQLVYEISGRDHHHLICRRCGATLEISHELLRPVYQKFEVLTGYHIDSLHVTFFGLCPACQHLPGNPGCSDEPGEAIVSHA
ncbi:MAG: transcriptional repressor [Anaerolineales bacterium]|nr:transcriptional repressor [Anaerolineales bacterium]